MAELPVAPELLGLVELGVDYGLHLAKDENPFHPALITETATGERGITQLLLLAPEAAKDPFQFAVSQLRDQRDATRAAIVVSGSVHAEGEEADAVLVFVGERGDAHSHEFAQAYRVRRLPKKVETLGKIRYAGERPAIFANGGAA